MHGQGYRPTLGSPGLLALHFRARARPTHLVRRVRSGVVGRILCPHIEGRCLVEEHEALEAADGREVAREGVEAGHRDSVGEGGDVLMEVKGMENNHISDD